MLVLTVPSFPKDSVPVSWSHSKYVSMVLKNSIIVQIKV